MQFGRGSRKSIRYSIFIGVLAGSVFSGSGAYGIDLATISADIAANNDIALTPNANYEAGNPSSPPFQGTTYFGSYSGTFTGNGATISGLTVPLFDYLSGSITNLNIETAIGGVVGQGILSNTASAGSVISNVSAAGRVNSENNDAGGLVGDSRGTITGSNTSGTIVSTQSYVGGIAGRSSGVIENSNSSMSVSSSGNFVGGLVGMANGEIIGSHATGAVESSGFGVVGGLVGYASGSSGEVGITNSYATGAVEGYRQVGGLIGLTGDTVVISESHATGLVTGNTEVGGLVGLGGSSSGSTTTISESFATGTVHGSGNEVGGLVGFIRYNGQIIDSYATGDVVGVANVGGIAGSVDNSVSITNVASTGDIQATGIVGGIVGSYSSSATLTNVSSFGSVTATDHGAGSLVGVMWSGNIDGYRAVATVYDAQYYSGAGSGRLNACDCRDDEDASYVESFGQVLSGVIFDPTEYLGDGGDGGTSPRRERIEREFREVLETRTVEKIEKSDGLKKEATVTKDAAIAFVEPTEKIEVAKVKAVEIAPTANVKVVAKAGEALQISLKSESIEPVELWVKSPDGTWLLAGVITFDKNGKAILPPLQLKNAGDYSLVLSRQSADSAKGSAPLNQTGSLLVAVS